MSCGTTIASGWKTSECLMEHSILFAIFQCLSFARGYNLQKSYTSGETSRNLFLAFGTSLNYLPTKVATCCVLHNICEIRADKLTADYFEDIPDEDVSDFALQNIDTNAEEIRNSLTEFSKTQ